MTAPFMLTAGVYWIARQREGWVYVLNPTKPWYAAQRLGNLAYMLAEHVQCLDDLAFTPPPIRYPGDLLDTAWDHLVAQKVVAQRL